MTLGQVATGVDMTSQLSRPGSITNGMSSSPVTTPSLLLPMDRTSTAFVRAAASGKRLCLEDLVLLATMDSDPGRRPTRVAHRRGQRPHVTLDAQHADTTSCGSRMDDAQAPGTGSGDGEHLDFGADLAGVRMVEFVEDVDGVLPGGAGQIRVAGRLMGVTEVSERFGLLDPIAVVSREVEGVFVAIDGLIMLA